MKELLEALNFSLSTNKAEFYTETGSIKITWDENDFYKIACHNKNISFYDEIAPEYFSLDVVINKVLFLLDVIGYAVSFGYENSLQGTTSLYRAIAESFARIKGIGQRLLKQICQEFSLKLDFLFADELILLLQQINLYIVPVETEKSPLEVIPNKEVFKEARVEGRILFEYLVRDYQIKLSPFLGCGYYFTVFNDRESFELWLVPKGDRLVWEFRKLPIKLRDDILFYDPMEFAQQAIACPF